MMALFSIRVITVDLIMTIFSPHASVCPSSCNFWIPSLGKTLPYWKQGKDEEWMGGDALIAVQLSNDDKSIGYEG